MANASTVNELVLRWQELRGKEREKKGDACQIIRILQFV